MGILKDLGGLGYLLLSSRRVGPSDDKVDHKKDNDNGADHKTHAPA